MKIIIELIVIIRKKFTLGGCCYAINKQIRGGMWSIYCFAVKHTGYVVNYACHAVK